VLVSIDGSVIVVVLIGFYFYLKLLKPSHFKKSEIFSGMRFPQSLKLRIRSVSKS